MSVQLVRAFPQQAGIDYEKTSITVPMYRGSEYLETLEGHAWLKIERLEPFKNAFNVSQLDFIVHQWEVHAFSKSLNQHVFMSLSDTPQPKNTCVSVQAGADFPALIVYNAIYDIYVGNARIAENQTGLGIGHNITSIPPNENIDFQKLLQYDDFITIYGSCACPSGALMAKEDFEREVNEIIELRTSL